MKKYSRGYVRASTERMFYRADQCFWQQFCKWCGMFGWDKVNSDIHLGPTEEFPGEKTWMMRENKEDIAVDKDEAIAAQIRQEVNQEDARNRQNEMRESSGPQPFSNLDDILEVTDPREWSPSNQNIANRNKPKTTRKTQAIDWGIVTIQRRKEYRRQLKRGFSKKKKKKKKTAVEETARLLAKSPSATSTSTEQTQILQRGELDRAQPWYSTTHSQKASSTSYFAAKNTYRESQHSSEAVQHPRAPPSQLQTLDEMIEEEREIARKFGISHGSFLDREEGISMHQSRDGLGEVGSEITRAANGKNPFCVVL
ncbi:hypothetical protein NHQ30_004537 [Ciborinia camelliae]|nr:hypothetical protein NHQ30_004537 [Ciborinia camelliae]